MTDIRSTYRLMSSASLLEIAASERPVRSGFARAELRKRIARGDVDDMDHAEASRLGLIS